MEFALGASVGVAQLQAGETPTEWIDRADRAMYQAKAAGKARVLVAPEADAN